MLQVLKPGLLKIYDLMLVARIEKFDPDHGGSWQGSCSLRGAATRRGLLRDTDYPLARNGFQQASQVLLLK